MLWIAGSIFVLIMAGWSWREIDDDPFRSYTPFDRAPVADTRGWFSLDRAADCVPPGKSVMVMTPDRYKNETFYFFTVSLFPRNRPFPATYFGWDHLDLLAGTKYLVYYDTVPLKTKDLRLVCEPAEGVKVYERVAP